MATAELAQIRVLGPFHVVRQDGSVVAAELWRTGKTRDLLRLLALADGRPVRPEVLVERLWPGVPAERGRNSLRTATSQIRRTMGTPCVQRQPDGVVLASVWVDAVQFLADARQAHESARLEQHGRVVALALRAEELYRDDFQAYDDDAPWARTIRQDLLHTRHVMLVEAAASALEVGLHRESLDLATTAVLLDPTSETAQRVLMRAHAELGETGTALRVFESYRAHLAEELGTNPSPETRELHLRLLRDLGA